MGKYIGINGLIEGYSLKKYGTEVGYHSSTCFCVIFFLINGNFVISSQDNLPNLMYNTVVLTTCSHTQNFGDSDGGIRTDKGAALYQLSYRQCYSK